MTKLEVGKRYRIKNMAGCGSFSRPWISTVTWADSKRFTILNRFSIYLIEEHDFERLPSFGDEVEVFKQDCGTGVDLFQYDHFYYLGEADRFICVAGSDNEDFYSDWSNSGAQLFRLDKECYGVELKGRTIDIKVTLNNKPISPKDISEETWKELRKLK